MIKDDIVNISVELNFTTEFLEDYQDMYSYMSMEEIRNVLTKMIMADLMKNLRSIKFMEDLQVYDPVIEFELDEEYIEEMKGEMNE